MRVRSSALVAMLLLAVVGGSAIADGEQDVERVLDSLHRAAAEADADTYWDLFAEGAIFFGTDPEERWTIEEFRGYADPFFDAGRGWTYDVLSRHVFLGAGGDVAWFDEELTNERYGTCRGTGVLVRVGERWKIAQYNLSIPIPNDLAPEVVERIRATE